MNRIYRTIWNEKAGNFVAVSELAKSGGKKASSVSGEVEEAGGLLKAAAAALLLSFSAPLYALPTDGVVAAGEASISSAAGNMTITQTSQNAALNWQSFSVGQAEAVQFVQPNSSSVALNRVLGADPSSILGSLTANGQVFLVNPNGILFGQGASVNVGGLVASTLDISDGDLMAGEYNFAGTGDAGVLNQGSINADGGFVALLGANVSNQGVIAARLGTVALAAGELITLDVAGDGLLNVGIDQGAVNALVENGGMIQADGGRVLLSAQSAGHLLHTVVNNTGIVQARTIENRNGVIRLLGDMQSGTVNVAGTLDASAPNGGNGGFIDTSAATVKVADTTRVTTAAAQGLTGSWLIDPTDYTIAATGGDITGAVLSANLADTDITIQSASGGAGTAGDVNVNDVVSWSANKLTLNAQNNINIDTVMHGSGTASLALEYGQGAVSAGNTSTVEYSAPVNLPAGNNFSTLLGSDGTVINHTVITSLGAAGSTTGTDLQGMGGNLAGRYVLGSDIDAAATSAWNADAGFAPIGGIFTGSFNGLGHTIAGLTINRPDQSYVGLFSATDATASISNVGLIGGSVIGSSYAGGLAGRNGGLISNSYSTVNVSGSSYVGGLVGYGMEDSTVSNAYATGTVASLRAGGLVGRNDGTISNAYATGAVSGSNSGGLTGLNNGGTIVNSYWNTETSGSATSDGGTGLTTVEMQGALPTGFSAEIWGNGGNQTTPYLLSNPGPVLIASDASTTYYSAISSLDQLQRMNANLAANYALVNDIDASATSGWNKYAGFMPVGNGTTHFTGRFHGLSHTINDLTIDRPATDHVGFFGSAFDAQIRDVGLVNAQVTGRDYAGALLGTTVLGSAVGVYATGQVVGRNSVGGLMGYNNTMAISASFAANAVTGSNNVGGLMGETNGGVPAFGNYASGNVIGSGDRVGGLVGYNGFAFLIVDSYATGSVSGSGEVGGLVGYHYNGEIARSYSTGSVAGTSDVGGLVGLAGAGAVTNSFWNSETSGQASSAGGIARSSAEMLQQATFTGWDYHATWIGYEGHTNPLLRSFMTELTVTAADATKTYDGLAYSGGNGVIYSTTPSGDLLGSIAFSGTSQSATNAGSYVIAGAGLYSHQQGYIINYVDGALTVNRADLTLSTSDVSKIYDGGLSALGTATVSSGTLFSTDTISGGSFDYNDENAGAGNKTVTTSGVTVSDGNGGGNYNVNYVDNSSSTIDPYAVSLSGGRVYDGGTDIGASALSLGTLVGSETLGLSGSGTLSDQHVADGKTVTLGGLALADGTNGGVASNYTFIGGTQTADITQAALTLTSSDVSKVYDGDTTAAGTAEVSSGTVFTGDSISGGSFAYTDKNAGAGDKTVTTSGVMVSDGNGGGNYNINYVDNITSTIDPYAVSLTGGRVYDGGTDVEAAVLSGTLVGSETLGLSGTGTLSDKHVADGKSVSLGSLALADGTNGGVASNYTFIGGTQTIDITQAALTLTTDDVSKVYDGNTTAAGTAEVSSGTVFAGDTISGGSFTYTDENAGAGNRTVTTSGVTVSDGNGGANYSISYADNTTSTISPKALSVSGMLAADKTYDGNTAATLSGGALVGLVGAETLAFAGQSGAFADSGVGAGKDVAVVGIVLSDGTGLAANYSVSNPQGLTADITPVDTVPAPDGVSTRLSSAITSAVSIDSNDAWVGGSDAALSPSGEISDPNTMTGLNLTVAGHGLRLPEGVWFAGSRDDEELR